MAAMKSFFRQLSLVFASGCFGGVLNAGRRVVVSEGRTHRRAGGEIAPALTPAYLYQRMVWAVSGVSLFLIPAFKSRPSVKAFSSVWGPTMFNSSSFFRLSEQGHVRARLGHFHSRLRSLLQRRVGSGSSAVAVGFREVVSKECPSGPQALQAGG